MESLARERGIFTFAEVLLATLVLAMAATATAYWVETVNNLNSDSDQQTVGLSLIKSMESVITPLAFREPETLNFGPESGETLADFDDVDDFDGLVLSPPIDAERVTLEDCADWTVSVVVEIIDPITLEKVTSSDLRRIRVSASYKERPVVDVWWLRARSPFE